MSEPDQAETMPSAEPADKERWRVRVLDSRERFVVRRWWRRLALSETQAKRLDLPPPWPRGVRAILRRCESPDAAVLTEGFRKLWLMLEDDSKEKPKRRDRRDMQAWACVALLAAELDDDASGARPAQAFASQRAETGKPRVSELRFQRLQQSQSPEGLVRGLRRALAMTGDAPISVVHLADDVLLWCREYGARDAVFARGVEDRIAFRWAEDYFTAMARYAGHD